MPKKRFTGISPEGFEYVTDQPLTRKLGDRRGRGKSLKNHLPNVLVLRFPTQIEMESRLELLRKKGLTRTEAIKKSKLSFKRVFCKDGVIRTFYIDIAKKARRQKPRLPDDQKSGDFE